MAIQYHPSMGEALWCDYSGIEPEMIKRRLVVVVVPRASQRPDLTVVPISATPPHVLRPWQVRLDRDPYPLGSATAVWAKCDMINVVCFARLSGFYTRWDGVRRYRKMAVSQDELRRIREGIVASLGLAVIR